MEQITEEKAIEAIVNLIKTANKRGAFELEESAAALQSLQVIVGAFNERAATPPVSDIVELKSEEVVKKDPKKDPKK